MLVSVSLLPALERNGRTTRHLFIFCLPLLFYSKRNNSITIKSKYSFAIRHNSLLQSFCLLHCFVHTHCAWYFEASSQGLHLCHCCIRYIFLLSTAIMAGTQRRKGRWSSRSFFGLITSRKKIVGEISVPGLGDATADPREPNLASSTTSSTPSSTAEKIRHRGSRLLSIVRLHGSASEHGSNRKLRS